MGKVVTGDITGCNMMILNDAEDTAVLPIPCYPKFADTSGSRWGLLDIQLSKTDSGLPTMVSQDRVAEGLV